MLENSNRVLVAEKAIRHIEYRCGYKLYLTGIQPEDNSLAEYAVQEILPQVSDAMIFVIAELCQIIEIVQQEKRELGI